MTVMKCVMDMKNMKIKTIKVGKGPFQLIEREEG